MIKLFDAWIRVQSSEVTSEKSLDGVYHIEQDPENPFREIGFMKIK